MSPVTVGTIATTSSCAGSALTVALPLVPLTAGACAARVAAARSAATVAPPVTLGACAVSVTVDGMIAGNAYRLRNAYDPLVDVQEFVHQGGDLVLPFVGRTVAKPVGYDTALIALDREDLALEAFKALLTQQPDVELGLGDTSPRVLAVLDRAKRALSDPKARARAVVPPPAAKPTPAPAKP